MPIYEDRSREQRSLAPARPQARKAEEWVSEALDSLPLPHRPTPPTRETEEPRRPRATWTPEGEFVLCPYGSPLQRKARLDREWLHLQIQRYRRQLEPEPHTQVTQATQASQARAPSDLPQRLQQRQGRGHPLPAELHERLEAHLGAPLPRIVIHADEEADALAGALGAEAFTSGADVFFRRGAYDPHGEAGQRLLAHEAAHVLQQSRGLAGPGLDPDPALEEQARQAERGFTPRPALRLGLAAGLEVELPADERRVLDEGSALALRGAYRAVAHRLAQAYRQGSSAAEVAHALHKAEAATQMPLLEAVLTFLGRAEGLKAGLLRAYRGEEPQPAVAQASPALQRKAEAKPGEAWTRYYRGTAPQGGGQGIAFDLKIHRAPDGRLSALYRVTPGSGITWRMTGAVLPNGSFYLERADHGALVRGRYQNDNTLLVDYVRIVGERDPSPKPDDRKDLVFDNLVLEPSSDPLIEGASATGIEQTPRGTNLIQEIQTEPFVEAEDATRKRQESSGKPDDLDQLMGFKRKTPRYSVDQIQEARRRISLVKDEIERGNLYLLLQTKVIYRNQRDNNSTENGSKIGWKMCNLTSLAMALEVLGIKNPDQKKQFEDALEDYGRKNIRYWNRESPGNNGWKGLAESLYVKIDGQRYDVSVKFLLNPGANSRMPQDWWETTVLPELKSGNSIIMSVRGHIVRLQGMNNVGLVVDDPNGLADLSTYGGSDPITAMYSTNKERTNYANANAKEGSVGEGAKGEDNVWPWRSVVNHKWWWVAVLSLVKSN